MGVGHGLLCLIAGVCTTLAANVACTSGKTEIVAEAVAGRESMRKPTDLYLLIGQSNMAGRGITNAANRLSPERVLKFTKDRTWAEGIEPIHFDRPFSGAGPGLGFARAMADADKDAEPANVPVPESEGAFPGCRLFECALPAYGFYLRHADRIMFESVSIEPTETDIRKPIVADDATCDCSNLAKKRCSANGFIRQ